MFRVIFDMDGTLLDTQRICVPAWDWAGEKQGILGAGKHIKEVCGMNEAGWNKLLKDNYPSIDTDKFNNDVREYFKANLVIKFKKVAEELIYFLIKNIKFRKVYRNVYLLFIIIKLVIQMMEIK